MAHSVTQRTDFYTVRTSRCYTVHGNCMCVHKQKHGLACGGLHETHECSATCSKHFWNRISWRLEKRLVRDRGIRSAHNTICLLCKHCLKCAWREYSQLYQLSKNNICCYYYYYYYYYYYPSSAHFTIETNGNDVPLLRSTLQRRTLLITPFKVRNFTFTT